MKEHLEHRNQNADCQSSVIFYLKSRKNLVVHRL
ncbi:predicted protein [Botrytis cinerea T4]|uniref:Uncharacterized protein n=1 Tax=Botryotinia fuckeliana (strain T4) TaxID=999810 RepID=G2XNH0_BOTF4|nr:predicted protein [Botrytis cinerea T4]